MGFLVRRRGVALGTSRHALALWTIVSALIFIQTAHAAPPDARELSKYSTMQPWELERELKKQSLGGPITVLTLGGGTFISGQLTVMIGLLQHMGCSYGHFESEPGYSDCRSGANRVLIGGGIAMGVGALIAGGGGLWLSRKIKKRRVIEDALDARKPDPLAPELSLGITGFHRTPTLGLNLTF